MDVINMKRKLNILVCLIVFASFFACLIFGNVKAVKAHEYSEEYITLNDGVVVNDDGMQGNYIILDPANPNNMAEDDKTEETRVTVVFIVTGIFILAIIGLVFIAGVVITVAYIKFAKSMNTVDKLKNTFFGKLAIKAAKTSGQPVAAGVATAIEKAPTQMFREQNVDYDNYYQDDEEEYEY
jgi:hypothetical protein